jgi:hypothetical protein
MNRQEAFQQLLAGTIEVLRIEPDGELYFGAPPPGLILSGAFNPLHAGHIALAKSAAWLVGREPLFELAVLNADKGAIAAEEIERRAAQFSQRYPLLLSREPLFTRKALLYPGSDFALGYDTAIMVAPLPSPKPSIWCAATAAALLLPGAWWPTSFAPSKSFPFPLPTATCSSNCPKMCSGSIFLPANCERIEHRV